MKRRKLILYGLIAAWLALSLVDAVNEVDGQYMFSPVSMIPLLGVECAVAGADRRGEGSEWLSAFLMLGIPAIVVYWWFGVRMFAKQLAVKHDDAEQ